MADMTKEHEKEYRDMLANTGKQPNLVYMSDQVAITLGVDPEDLDSLRDHTGLVAINSKRAGMK